MYKEFTDLVKAFLKAFNFSESESNLIIFRIVFIGFVFAIFRQLWKWLKYLVLKRNQRILNHDLNHFYSPADVYNRTKYYITPKFQNVAPSEDDEPGRRYIASAKNKLIPLFLKEVFPFGKNDNKHFLILADSGMGKTAFLINLYISYKNQWQNPLGIKKYDIKLFPIWHQDTFDFISKIPDSSNTILLLDAFDEDIEAGKDYKKRLAEIIDKTNRFRIIVITSRTQFFPSQKEEPHETGYFTGGDKGEYKFQKLYLSAFDDKDIDKYLQKRFHILYQFKKYKKARRLVEKCPNLVVRPMLLSFVDDLIKSDMEFVYSFQVYEEMIKHWLIRESKKNGIKQRFGTEEAFQEELYKFSEKLAADIYNNKDSRNGLFISSNEQFSSGLLNLEDFDEQYSLTAQEIKGKSLLNRNAAGEYKFSHKSILEYFLAKEFFETPDFYAKFDFLGMDAAKRFFAEILILQLRNCQGSFTLAGTGKNQSLLNLNITNVARITFLDFSVSDEHKLDIRFLKHLSHLEILYLFNSKFGDVKAMFQVLEYYKMTASVQIGWAEILINSPEIKEILDIYTFLKQFNDSNIFISNRFYILGEFGLTITDILGVISKYIGNGIGISFPMEAKLKELGIRWTGLSESDESMLAQLLTHADQEKLATVIWDKKPTGHSPIDHLIEILRLCKEIMQLSESSKEMKEFKEFISKISFLKVQLPNCRIMF